MTPIEIRERVAREVMGLGGVCRGLPGRRLRGTDLLPDDLYPCSAGDELCVPGKSSFRQYDRVPAYESDIAAAFQVVEEMRKRGWDCFIVVKRDKTECNFIPVGVSWRTDHEALLKRDPVTAMAISLAALAALEAK